MIKNIAVILFLAIVLFTACDTTVKTDEAQIGEAITAKSLVTPSEVYEIDTAQSVINWIGSKMTGRHNGHIKIETGELHLKDSLLTSGSIVIDMTTLKTDDKTIDLASNQKLTKHLKSADFFDTDAFNTAKFELTGVAPYDSTANKSNTKASALDSKLKVKNPTHLVTGNLTLKGKTKSITFPAKITFEDNQLKAKANFNIDRTKWGLVYRSDKALGNQTIYSEVNIGLDIVANPN